MRLLLTIANIFIFTSSWAALGPLVEKAKIPQSICKLTLTKSDDSTFHCSGILLDSFHVKTAAHCLEKDVKKIKVQCHDQEAMVLSERIAESFSFNDIKKELEYRRFDQAVLELENKIDLPVIPLLTDAEEIKKFVKESEECGFFGVGHNPWKKGTGTLHGVKAPANKLEWYRDVLILNAPYHAVSMIGDSGASLLCRKKDQRWYNIGTISAHSWEKETIIAPNSFLPQKDFNPVIYEESIKSTLTAKPTIKRGHTYWVKPFSEFLYNEKLYNTVDRLLVKFTVEEITSGKVKGKLSLTSSSHYYLCLGANLCHLGELGQVVIDSSVLADNYHIPHQFMAL